MQYKWKWTRTKVDDVELYIKQKDGGMEII